MGEAHRECSRAAHVAARARGLARRGNRRRHAPLPHGGAALVEHRPAPDGRARRIVMDGPGPGSAAGQRGRTQRQRAGGPADDRARRRFRPRSRRLHRRAGGGGVCGHRDHLCTLRFGAGRDPLPFRVQPGQDVARHEPRARGLPGRGRQTDGRAFPIDARRVARPGSGRRLSGPVRASEGPGAGRAPTDTEPAELRYDAAQAAYDWRAVPAARLFGQCECSDAEREIFRSHVVDLAMGQLSDDGCYNNAESDLDELVARIGTWIDGAATATPCLLCPRRTRRRKQRPRDRDPRSQLVARQRCLPCVLRLGNRLPRSVPAKAARTRGAQHRHRRERCAARNHPRTDRRQAHLGPDQDQRVAYRRPPRPRPVFRAARSGSPPSLRRGSRRMLRPPAPSRSGCTRSGTAPGRSSIATTCRH